MMESMSSSGNVTIPELRDTLLDVGCLKKVLQSVGNVYMM